MSRAVRAASYIAYYTNTNIIILLSSITVGLVVLDTCVCVCMHVHLYVLNHLKMHYIHICHLINISQVAVTAPNHMIWEIRIGVVFLRGCGLPI